MSQNKLSTLLTYQQKKPLKVNIYSEDNNKILSTGELKFIDNTVDPQTNALLLKAKITNSKQLLWPGLKVNVELIFDVQAHALVVPLSAVQLDQEGSFVYIVENGKAKTRRITLDRQVENVAVIAKGLNDGETVITVIPPNLKEGMSVQR